ncbi:ribokinase [soil metagenome]
MKVGKGPAKVANPQDLQPMDGPMDVVVLGSLNMDLVARVAHLPQPGETLLSEGFATVPGGKGANQAVAAARLGAATAMVGRVGEDGFGQVLRDRLQAESIDTSAVATSQQAPSGTALIAVSPDNNQIIITAGANGEVSAADLDRLSPYFEQAKILLLQFEIPLPIVEKAAALAHLAGLTVIVDPAPAHAPLSPNFCQHISILTPNQTEAAVLSGRAVETVEEAIAAAETLQRQGIAVVIVKLGAQGVVCATADGSFIIPAFSVRAIDTVAAGDAFNGGLAAALCQIDMQTQTLNNRPLLTSAIRYASAVAALAVTQSGAQSAMPTMAQVEAFLETQKKKQTA